jgi:ABC-type Fe3+/spermidine/putrescine transport system ATPase subunit
VIRLILSIFTLALCATFAAPIGTSPEVAVVLQVDETFSPQAWQAMEAESKRIAKQAGIRVRFVERSQAAAEQFTDLVVFRMKGKCEMDTTPALLDERGPFAWAFTADGNVLPFGEVKCDRVRESIKTALHPSDYRKADQLFGRALGRVVAHELYHMLANTKKHGKSGVAKDALSAQQLISEKLDFSMHERVTLEGKRDFSR